MKKNPFEELGITIKPKALFQAYSNEANQVGVETRIEVLAKIIYADYSLKEVVDDYLQGKDAATDKVRKNEIIDTLNLYSRTILDEVLESGSYSPKVKKLIKNFYDEENEPKRLQDATNAFVIAIKERFAIRDLLIAYIENSQDYFVLSSVIGREFGKD